MTKLPTAKLIASSPFISGNYTIKMISCNDILNVQFKD